MSFFFFFGFFFLFLFSAASTVGAAVLPVGCVVAAEGSLEVGAVAVAGVGVDVGVDVDSTVPGGKAGS